LQQPGAPTKEGQSTVETRSTVQATATYRRSRAKERCFLCHHRVARGERLCSYCGVSVTYLDRFHLWRAWRRWLAGERWRRSNAAAFGGLLVVGLALWGLLWLGLLLRAMLGVAASPPVPTLFG